MMKECNKCKQVLALDMFYKCKANKDGLQCQCKQCQNLNSKIFKTSDYKKQHYINNIEKYKLNSKKEIVTNREYVYQRIKNKHNTIPPGVYMVKCLFNNKCYIGQSIKPYRRAINHLSVYKENKVAIHHSNIHIQSDLKQYGRKSFIFGIIEHCEPEQLLERERHYINLYKPEYN